MEEKGVNVKSICMLIAALLVIGTYAVGCATQDWESTPTQTPTPTLYTPALTPTPSPTPTTVSKTFNITHDLSGLAVTITVVSWTDNEMVVEWVIDNQTDKDFDANRIYSIFTPGSLASDQTGREGEYFIPESFRRRLEPGDIMHYETKWLFYPESEEITIRLSDIHTRDGSNYFYTSAEYVFPR